MRDFVLNSRAKAEQEKDAEAQSSIQGFLFWKQCIPTKNLTQPEILTGEKAQLH